MNIEMMPYFAANAMSALPLDKSPGKDYAMDSEGRKRTKKEWRIAC